MFVVKIYGGLGNQIFQYIFGKYIEKKFSCDVVFDFYYFEKFNYRKPNLPKIVKNVDTLSDYDIHRKFNPTNSFKINSIWNSVYNRGSYINERIFNNLKFHSFNKDTLYYFDGYWQNKEYFNFFSSNDLDSFFAFGDSNLINNVIGIHVRRGDYLKAPNDKIFYTQNIDYYKSSIDFLAKEYNLSKFNTRVVVFTDDENWVISNLQFDFKTSILSGFDYEDFLLLCYPKYLIMSNSTFSCAAAHLSNKDKIVISPNNWYKDNLRNNLVKSKMYNENWIII